MKKRFAVVPLVALSVLLLMAGFAVTPAAADSAPSAGGLAGLIADAVAPTGLSVKYTSVVARHRFVRIDMPALGEAIRSAANGGPAAALPLFPDVTATLTSGMSDVRQYGYGWSGHGTGPDGADQQAVLTVSDNGSPADTEARLLGSVTWGPHTYKIQPVGNGVHLITDAIGRQTISDGDIAPASITPAGSSGATTSAPLSPTQNVSLQTASVGSGNGQFVDILAVTTPAARASGTDITMFLNNEVDIANTANYDSAIPWRFRVVNVQATNFQETDDYTTDLTNLINGNGQLGLGGVPGWRNQYGADIVTLIGRHWSTQSTGTQICGLGRVMTTTISNAFAPYAMNLQDTYNCGGYVLAHEAGHNMGLFHEWGNAQLGDNNNSAFNPGINHGYADLVGHFETIMSNSTTCESTPIYGCTQINEWSNADRTYNNGTVTRPTGMPSSAAQPAFDASAINQSQATVSAFRATASNPIGAYDREQRYPGGIHVYGWALDFDWPDPQNNQLSLNVTVDGASTANGATGSSCRTDIAALYPSFGGCHGYEIGVPVATGTHRICVTGINYGAGSNVSLGCHSVFVTSQPFGALDTVVQHPGNGAIRVGGWAIDPETANSIYVNVIVDGVNRARLLASDYRYDIDGAYPGYGGNHGFNWVGDGLGGGTHSVYVQLENYGVGSNVNTGTSYVNIQFNPVGSFDYLYKSNLLTYAWGWAFDWDTDNAITIKTTVNGVAQPDQTANTSRADIPQQSAYQDYSGYHGFNFAVIALQGQVVCITAVNVGTGSDTSLGCQSAP